MNLLLTEKAVQSWDVFLNNQDNKGHLERINNVENIEEYVRLCFDSSNKMTSRVKADLPNNFEPKSILEIGSSAGLNCYALQMAYPSAQVTGVEPEEVAVAAAKSMEQKKDPSPTFIVGFGETLPFDDMSFDLIICHTVIEHVQDVKSVIGEMSRVLMVGGAIHLDAPNYIWPYEPHLEIYTIPIFGKWFVKLTAILQGKKKHIGFLNHLKFVTPGQLQRAFKQNGLVWKNRAKTKLLSASRGEGSIIKYKKSALCLFILNKIGVSDFVICALLFVGLYPSVMYTLQKHHKTN